MTKYSQRDSRWSLVRLGFGKTTIGTHGCFITCLSMMVDKTPDVVNEILKKAGAFNGDLLISEKAAEALNLDYFGKEYDVNKEPNYLPNIKEVDMSPSAGKQQHFVVRAMENGKKVIIDPWTGTTQVVGKYPFVSYRLFKLKEVICNHSCPKHC